MLHIKKIFVFSAKLFLSILFTLILLEAGLRIFPSLIPLELLIHFHEKPREEIAHRRGLPNRRDVITIERDDGGPNLEIFKPFTKIVWPIKDNGTVSVVVMDENGFCNPPENSYQLPEIDIITLGDSFTACHAVDPQDTWTSQLGALMGLSVYNLGKIGIGVHEYLQIFKKFGLQKSPQVVIMNVYEGNDLRDARKYYENLHDRGREGDQDIQSTSTTGLSPYLGLGYKFFWEELLEDNSYFFNLAQAVVARYLDPDLPKTNFKYRLIFPNKTIPFNPENTDTDEVEHARRLQAMEVKLGTAEAIEAALVTFVELSRQYDFVPIVSYTPSAHTAYAANVVFDDPALHDLMPWFSRWQREYLKQGGEELGYIFIDLTPSLQAAAQARGWQDLLYYRYDLHLTPSGHTVVAGALSQALQDLGIAAR